MKQARAVKIAVPFVPGPNSCWLLSCERCGGDLVPDPEIGVMFLVPSDGSGTRAYCSDECARAHRVFPFCAVEAPA